MFNDFKEYEERIASLEQQLQEAVSINERVAVLIAHRQVGNQEHDAQNGKLAGYCVVCQIPWPCEYAYVPPQSKRIAELTAENEKLKACRPIIDEGYRLNSSELDRLINEAPAASELSWAIKDLMLTHYVIDGLHDAETRKDLRLTATREALKGLVDFIRKEHDLHAVFIVKDSKPMKEAVSILGLANDESDPSYLVERTRINIAEKVLGGEG